PGEGYSLHALTLRSSHATSVAASSHVIDRTLLEAPMRKIGVAVLAAVVASLSVARADDYPNRLIKFMQGFPPGGNVDIIARILANQMEKSLGQSIVVEAKPGLAGSLAAEAIARSEPDGYSLLV